MRRFLTVQFIIAVSACIIAAQQVTVTAAADPYPPYIDPDLPSQGLSMEIIREALSTQGYRVELVVTSWIRAKYGVENGTYDILPDVWRSETYRSNLFFSDEYATTAVKFIKRKGDAFEYAGIESLAGKKISTVKGYNYADEFNKSSAFTRDDSADLVANVTKVVMGSVDLTLEDEVVTKCRIAKTDPTLLDKIEFTKKALSIQPLYIACATDSMKGRRIVDAFNKGLALIKANKTYDRILERYGMERK